MLRVPLLIFAIAATLGGLILMGGTATGSWWWLVLAGTAISLVLLVHELAGRPIPFLRWSFLRLLLGLRHLGKEWQVGDGREEGAARFVLERAPAGNLDAAIAAIDEYAYRRSFLINVGDEKGRILDRALEAAKPRTVIELGAYVGYSALRIARRLPPGGRLFSIEFSAANAAIARRVVAHAGAADRVTIVVGSIGDGGKTLAHLQTACGLGPGAVDLIFLDHAKEAYVPDLKRLLEAGLLHPGTIAVADNVRFPGAPEYQAYMDAEEGRTWTTRAHETHAEYQSLIKDIVLESRLL